MNTELLYFVLPSMVVGYIIGNILFQKNITLDNFSEHNWVSLSVISVFFGMSGLALASIYLPSIIPVEQAQILINLASTSVPTVTLAMVGALALKTKAFQVFQPAASN